MSILQSFSLAGQVALVTGASRGLGQAMAVALAEAGADIVAVATNTENLRETVAQVEAVGRKALPSACDSRDRAQIDKVVQTTLQEFGKLDILVNNAGTIRRAPAHEFSDEDWAAVLDTNLTGVFQFCRAAGKAMLEQGNGKIINIASLLSFSGGITVPAYAASKGGVAQLTKALANEWANNNIQVNAIAPGYFATDNTANLRADETRNREISARIPAGRWGQPQDLAGAAVFLASRAADYVNGAVLLVDGGWMAR
jgi:2-deoxy-D-gluconate 3-dehydrogenase